jgi:hypothetical protein
VVLRTGLDLTVRQNRKAQPVPSIATMCPCDEWQLEVEVGALHSDLEAAVAQAVREHLGECIILAASGIAARAAR